MVKETKLINKVKSLIRRAGLPRFLYRYSPKKWDAKIVQNYEKVIDSPFSK